MNLTLQLLKSLLVISIITLTANSQTVYVWNGSVNSNFSTAGNWTPFRQVGLANDVLVFDNTGSIAVANVYQVTIGQLVVRNNSNVTLSPASGNTKCITIKGAEGEDLVIEAGSSLKISGSDPALNVFLNSGATASVSGSFIFTGSIAHNLNAADAQAIKFKNGSVFSQLCPGNIFNTTGVTNAVVFESGSTMKVDHSGALSPFGVSAPNSKILLQPQSTMVITHIGSMQFSGRQFGNLVIEQNNSLNISESFTSDVSIESINVKNGGSFTISNTNTAFTPSVSLKGSLTVNGAFTFGEAAGKLKVKLNGTSQQNISGTGSITFPSSLEFVLISSSISLSRDLSFDCRVLGTSGGSINANGFSISYNPAFPEPFASNSKDFGNSTLNSTKSAGEEVSTQSKNNSPEVPSEFSLSQNYPNPFNPSTKINFSLPIDSKVNLVVYDMTGRVVAILAEGNMNAGLHAVSLDAGKLSSGVYFYTLTAGNFSKTMKMVLAK